MVYLSQPCYSAHSGSSSFGSFGSYGDRAHQGMYTLETLLPDSSPGYEGSHSSIPPAAIRLMQASTEYDSPAFGYSVQTGQSHRDYHAASHHDYHAPVQFLNPHRPASQFIGKGHDIRHYIRDTFKAMMGSKLPDDIVISVVSEKELHDKHKDFGGSPSAGLQGFSINQSGQRIVIVKENELDQLMLTVGHELGHVLTPTLEDAHDEEAKAFSFEMAWLEAITANDIAGLGASFIMPAAPANNGLHNVAFAFVKDMLKAGKQALSLYTELIQKLVEVKNHALL